jgi:hypothetical protein
MKEWIAYQVMATLLPAVLGPLTYVVSGYVLNAWRVVDALPSSEAGDRVRDRPGAHCGSAGTRDSSAIGVQRGGRWRADGGVPGGVGGAGVSQGGAGSAGGASTPCGQEERSDRRVEGRIGGDAPGFASLKRGRSPGIVNEVGVD